MLKVSRLAAVAGGSLGVLLAIVLPSVIGSLTVFYSLLSVSLFVPVVGGLYTRRAGTPEALAAIGVGVTALVAARLAPPLAGVWTPNTVGLVASVLAFAILLVARTRQTT